MKKLVGGMIRHNNQVVSEIIYPKKIDTLIWRRQITDRHQTDGNGSLNFSYFRGHETSRKHESKYLRNGPYYNTSLGYSLEVKFDPVMFRQNFPHS